MASIKNTENHYGIVAILLHWVMAFIIIGLVILGLYMTSIPVSALKLKLYGWHKETGILVLMLVLVRLEWRLTNTTPALPLLKSWERMAAHAVHWAFYLLLLALPLTGWLMTSAANLPASFFGLFLMPNLIAPSEEWRSFFGEVHQWLAYGLILLFFMHAAAALKHHFIDKDDILRRIIS